MIAAARSAVASAFTVGAFAMANGAEDAAFEFQPAVQNVSGHVTVRFSLKTVSL